MALVHRYLRPPSLQRGTVARNPSESRYPHLWQGAVLLLAPGLGYQGRQLIDWSVSVKGLSRAASVTSTLPLIPNGIISQDPTSTDTLWSTDGAHRGDYPFFQRALPGRAQLEMNVLASDATARRVLVPHHDALSLTTQGTIMCWAKMVTGLSGMIVGKGNENYYFSIVYPSGNIYFEWFNGTYRGLNFQPPTELVLNKWYHYAVTWDNASMRGFRDGRQMNLPQSMAAPLLTNTSDVQLWRSSETALAANIFRGAIDDLRIYNRVMSADEIRESAEIDLGIYQQRPRTLMFQNNHLMPATPSRAQYQVNTASVTIGLRSTPSRAQYQASPTNIIRQQLPSRAQYRAMTPRLSLQSIQPYRPITAPQRTALNATITNRFLQADWLIRIPAADIQWSYTYDPDGTWEHRIAQIGNIDIAVPPGGGISTVSDVTIQAYEDGTGQSILTRQNATQRLLGQPISITLLLLETGQEFLMFTGVIQQIVIRDAIVEILSVDSSLPRDGLLPLNTLLNNQYPLAAPSLIGQPIPLVYGSGERVGGAPLLFVDTSMFTYLIANHPMVAVGDRYAIFENATEIYLPRSGDVQTESMNARITFNHAIQEYRFNETIGTTLLQNTVSVSGAEYAFDGLSSPVATIATANINSNLDGYGLLGVGAGYGSASRGLNTLIVSAENHRRGVSSDPTVTGKFTIQTIDASTTTTVLRPSLFESQDFRHALNPQNSTFTITSLQVGPNERVECLLLARNEGGVGGSLDYYEIGELRLTVFYQPEGDNAPVYLYTDWEGRADDSAGTLTGEANALLSTFSDIVGNLLLEELSQELNTDIFMNARAFFVANTLISDGGIGYGWSDTRLNARELLAKIARQATSILFVDFEGLWRMVPFDQSDGANLIDINQGNILANQGQELTLASQRNSSFVVDFGDITRIANHIEIHYHYDVGVARYTKIFYASHEGTNALTNGGLLTALCQNSVNRYGVLPILKIEANFIYDETTADFLLNHIVQYFWSQRINITCDIPLQVGVTLLPGTFITLTHAFLPSLDQGRIFEIHKLSYRPSLGRVNIQASRVSSVVFEYFALKDSSDVIWYFWYDVVAQLVRDTTIPSMEPLSPVDISEASIPYWLQTIDELGGTWYLYPDTLGQMTIDSSGPGVGFGVAVGLGKEALSINGLSYRLGARSWQEWVIEAV